MAARILESELGEILAVIRHLSGKASTRQIAGELEGDIPHRALQHRIRELIDSGLLIKQGDRRWTKYRLAEDLSEVFSNDIRVCRDRNRLVPYSAVAEAVRAHCRKPLADRFEVGYRFEFLDTYRPNADAYISEAEREYLHKIGAPKIGEKQPAGTYASQILGRLLIDLSWNSSRLEGNTLSLLDTRRLFGFGQKAEGKKRTDVQMILNHKTAIEFLVKSADRIGFNRYTFSSLHGALSENLLVDRGAVGRLRRIPVQIGQSTFLPLGDPWQIEEYFDRLLTKADAIEDPFEQSFFLMVQLPYLQPFEDVNKRTSRLAANIPLIQHNLSPLTFTDVPQNLYTEAILGVYELNNIDLLKDVYLWAYQRSAARYVRVRKRLGEPDSVQFRYRNEIRSLVVEVVRAAMGRKAALEKIAAGAAEQVETNLRERFRDSVESALLNLDKENCGQYLLDPEEVAIWKQAWDEKVSELPA